MGEWTSAVLISLPSLAAYTDRWRTASHDDVSDLPIAEQAPPHVTVLVPWAHDPEDAEARVRLTEAVAGFGPVELSFGSAGLFSNGLVYLVPEPDLTGLLRAVTGAFPELPAYGGHPDPYAHVTVSARGGATVLAEVEAALATEQPPRVTVDHLGIYAPTADGVWHERGRVPLAAPRSSWP